MSKSMVFLLLLLSLPLYAEDSVWPARGSWEFGFWSGGGSGVSGSTSDTELLLTGIRASKMITQEKEGGGFPGNLQFSLEAVPLFVIFQESTVYGIEVTPVLLRWNFQGTQKKVIPYFFGGAGTLLTSSDVPEGTSIFNFTPQGGFGLFFPVDAGRAMSFEARYMHISNGGLARPNPGINSIQLNIGYHWLR